MIVCDGSWLIHRALHVRETAALARTDGMPTGGVLNVLHAIRGALNAYKSEKCVVVFDGNRSARRTALYPDYKNRDRKPLAPDKKAELDAHTALFRHQLSILERALPYFGCRVARVMTKEGDDVIAHVARKAAFLGQEVQIVSDDKDLWQLVGTNISVYRPGAAYAGRADSYVCETNFRVVSGVSGPRRFLVRKAIVGDDSDVIDGVEGVGDKTATSFVEQVGDRFLQNATPSEIATTVGTTASCDSSARVRRLAEEESKKVVERNLELMDLSREPWTPEEEEQVKVVVFDGKVEFDRMKALSLCQALEYVELLSKWSYWLEPFRFLS